MDKWNSENVQNNHFIYISTDKINNIFLSFLLEERFKSTTTISGTRSHHHFLLKMEIYSWKELVVILSITDQIIFHINSLKPGMDLASIYDNKPYIGNIIDISDRWGEGCLYQLHTTFKICLTVLACKAWWVLGSLYRFSLYHICTCSSWL